MHLGHHEGTWEPLTRPYIYGLRSTQHIIDLEQTVECLKVRLLLRNILSNCQLFVILVWRNQSS